jgi:hypothetical protein
VTSRLVLVQQNYMRTVLFRLHFAECTIRGNHGIQCCINSSADLMLLKNHNQRGVHYIKNKNQKSEHLVLLKTIIREEYIISKPKTKSQNI